MKLKTTVTGGGANNSISWGWGGVGGQVTQNHVSHAVVQKLCDFKLLQVAFSSLVLNMLNFKNIIWENIYIQILKNKTFYTQNIINNLLFFVVLFIFVT